MFRYRHRGGRRSARRIFRIAKQAQGIVLSKRILIHDFVIPDVTSTDFDNPSAFDLVGAAEAMDEEIESTGGTTINTDVAAVPLYSRLLKMRLNMIFRTATSCMVRWMLVKNPDADITTASFMTAFHSSNDTQGDREIRKNILSKGFVNIPSDRLQAPLRIFVKRAAWQRASPMREGDRLRLIMAKESTGTTASLSGFGTIWVKANG